MNNGSAVLLNTTCEDNGHPFPPHIDNKYWQSSILDLILRGHISL